MALSTKQKNYITQQKNKLSAAQLSEKINQPIDLIEAFLQESQSDLSKGNQKWFTVIALCIPLVFFLFLEIGLRIGNYKGDLSLFIFPEDLKGEYGFPNPDYAKRYFFNTTVIPNPSRDSFLASKPDSSFRIFVLGESSAVGYPYGFNIKFSMLVKDALQDMLPNKLVEVVNLGTSAINSYTIYDQVDEVLEQKPDAILIYTGHNEFYGALGVGSSESLGAFPGFVRSYLKIQRLKTFLLLRDILTKMVSLFNDSSNQSGTLMERVVKEQEIPLGSDLYNLGKLQFESNMREIVNAFREKNIPVYISSLASNLKDHRPFVSIKTQNYPEAEKVYDEAELAYSSQNYSLADSLYTLARDLDALRFRAPTEFNNFIKTLAAETNSFYVKGEEAFKQHSPNGIIGHELMLEHLHPNSDGYAFLGNAFVEKIMESPPKGLDLKKELLKSFDQYKQQMHVSDFDTTLGNIKIVKLKSGWPFVKLGDKAPKPYFNPLNFADSLALKVANSDLNWEPAKVQVAEKYTERKQYDLAINEYMGIIKDTPYNASPYIFAARLYITLNNFEAAEPLLVKANQIEKNAFSSKMLGSIAINKKNYQKGIELLKESLRLNNKDAQAWYNLSGAYALISNLDEAISASKQVKKLDSNYPGIDAWINQLNRLKK